MLILEPSGAINCVSWLFNDLRPCLSFEDFLFRNQLVTALTGEVWFGGVLLQLRGGSVGGERPDDLDDQPFWIFSFSLLYFYFTGL